MLDIRVQAKRWVGPEWAVTYIGEGESIEAIRTILFPEPPEMDELQQAFLWQVSALVQKFTGEGDLVVCELNELVRWSYQGLNTFFTVPQWIRQILEDIDRPLENILADMNQSMRRKVRQLEKQGFSYLFTQEEEDFDLFYKRMYLPYIPSRHRGQGMVLRDYESIHNLFTQGGLILVKDGDDPVCGMVCVLEGDTCVAYQMGVLDGDFDLVKRGINVALWWFMLLWARDQGARRFDFGGSRAHTSNGVYNFKRQWGTRACIQEDRHTVWSFYAERLPEKLINQLNSLGIIAIEDGKFYRVQVKDPKELSRTANFNRELKQAAACGLSGLVVLSDDGEKQVIPLASS